MFSSCVKYVIIPVETCSQSPNLVLTYIGKVIFCSDTMCKMVNIFYYSQESGL